MKVTSFNFGRGQNLCGTLTMPAGPARPMAFLLLNAGVIHRVGPHRMNFKLARELARRGFASLRVDISGLGDSRFSAEPRATFQQQACADISDAIDALAQRTGIVSAAIVGMCSGAQNGLAAAAIDQRIAALYMIDGYAYATPRSDWHRRWFFLRRHPRRTLAVWLRLALGKWRAASDSAGSAPVEIDYGRSTPPKQVFADTVRALVNRGVHLAICFTGSWISRYSYARQWQDGFAGESFVDAVDVIFLPHLDHTMSTVACQREIIERVGDWALRVCAPREENGSALHLAGRSRG